MVGASEERRLDPSKPFAVIFMNLGGPDTIAAIRPFLVNLFSDKQIIKLPVQPLMARLIARTRSKKIAARYEAIGGGSPIVRLTTDQAVQTEKLLREEGYECRGYVGMNYWHPFIKEAVGRAVADGFDQILGFSLFPHYSRATTGACMRDLKSAVESLGKKVAFDAVEVWYDDKKYIEALAQTVQTGLDRFTPEERQSLKVVFSAHSLPKDFVDQGDPYPDHLAVTISGVLDLAGPLDWILAYQSRSGPVEWLEPQTDAVLDKLAEEGTKNILLVPISFVSDHIETLYEIDIMYKEPALARGVSKFERTPALNSSPAFIEALAGLVANRVGKRP